MTVLSDGSIEIDVFRKETHTNKYLDFASHNPMQHRGRGQDTPKQANLLPSHPELRTNEQDRVLHDLRANGYPDILLKCIRDRTKERPTQERPLGLAVVPYVRGASDRVGRVLKKFRVRTAFKPVRTLGHVFRKPKDRPVVNRMAGIVYKVKCHDCSFTYIGESKRLWSSRGAEHDPGRASNSESAIKQHAESTDLRAWCYQLQQEAFLGVVALHFGQQCYQRKQSFSSRFCAVNSKLKCHTNAQFGSASTNKLSLTLMKIENLTAFDAFVEANIAIYQAKTTETKGEKTSSVHLRTRFTMAYDPRQNSLFGF
ncbi:hypothetical protein ACROYT_G035334 [Oculina patagonica]